MLRFRSWRAHPARPTSLTLRLGRIIARWYVSRSRASFGLEIGGKDA